MPGNGNGGSGLSQEEETALTYGEGGRPIGPIDWGANIPKPPAPVEPPPPPPPKYGEKGYQKVATNVQRANIDRTSFYDPSVSALQIGADYLAERSATNPLPQGGSGVGAVGYALPDGNFPTRIY